MKNDKNIKSEEEWEKKKRQVAEMPNVGREQRDL